MPIRPDLRHFYGREWRQEIRPRILARAKNRCEQCRKPLHAWIFTYTWKTRDLVFGGAWRYHMIWTPAEGKDRCPSWRNEFGRRCTPFAAKGLPRKIRVRLTIAHKDNNPANMRPGNLRCWCTWCHLHRDAPFHKQTRSTRKDGGRPLLQEAQK